MTTAIFSEVCPNCTGPISAERLALAIPCENCIPDSEITTIDFSTPDIYKSISKILSSNGKLKQYKKIAQIAIMQGEFIEFFKKCTGFRPWSLQRTWARRVFQKRSFSITAPTGVGKSIFGTLLALFLAKKGKKTYIILPTRALVEQTTLRLHEFAKRAKVRTSWILSCLNGDESKEKIKEGKYRILLSSSQFLRRNIELIKDSTNRFDFVFIDDVDAFLKSYNNAKRALILLGYNEDKISLATELIREKIRAIKSNNTQQIKEIEKKSKKIRKTNSVLAIATATGSTNPAATRLYKEILGFEVGASREYIRNIEQLYTPLNLDKLPAILKKLGKGGLIFVPRDMGLDYCKKVLEVLNNAGFRAQIVHSKDTTGIEKLKNGQVDYLIGVATYYGVMVRGIDLPDIIRFVVFLGVPRFSFSLKDKPSLASLYLAQLTLDLLDEENQRKISRIVSKLRKFVPQIEKSKRAMQLLSELHSLITTILSDPHILDKLQKDKPIAITRENGRTILLIPDIRTYIQASGRASRLYAGGISKGIALVMVDNQKLFDNLRQYIGWLFPENSFMSFEDLDDTYLEKILATIDQDREKISEILKGKIRPEQTDLIKSALLVVESPNKARTIANFFGRPTKRKIGKLLIYDVHSPDMFLSISASGGHIFDLGLKGYHGVLVENSSYIPYYVPLRKCANCGYQIIKEEDRKCPRCKSKNINNLQENIRSLQEIALEVDYILIGTDPDTEGEKIAWDLSLILSPYLLTGLIDSTANLHSPSSSREPNHISTPPANTTNTILRVEYHEVSRRAITRSLKEPRLLEGKKVMAQIVRRIEDRWIGFELSGKLQKEFKNKHLSAGRVQSPVLGWIIERYNQHQQNLQTVSHIRLENGLNVKLPGEVSTDIATLRVIQRYVDECSPRPPFTTADLIQEATRKLRLDSAEVMNLAQDLFELSFITYHRTDSTHISPEGIDLARRYITSELKLPDEYLSPRIWAESGTHEAIRPVRPLDVKTLQTLLRASILQTSKKISSYHLRLYDLIFRRFIASQMRKTQLELAKITITANNSTAELTGYTKILQDGWNLIYPLPYNKLPDIQEQDVIQLKIIDKQVRLESQFPLYTQADIIELMKTKKIGRPSTYSKIISTLLERKYIYKDKYGRLIPTELGTKVYDYLTQRYSSVISEERTRELEEKMDLIERGELEYIGTIKELHEEIQQKINK